MDSFKDLNKIGDVHLRCHAYWGGEKKGRCMNLGIDESHGWESGTHKGNYIDLDKKAVIELVRNLNLWLVNEEADFDYGQDEDKLVKVEWETKKEDFADENKNE